MKCKQRVKYWNETFRWSNLTLVLSFTYTIKKELGNFVDKCINGWIFAWFYQCNVRIDAFVDEFINVYFVRFIPNVYEFMDSPWITNLKIINVHITFLICYECDQDWKYSGVFSKSIITKLLTLAAHKTSYICKCVYFWASSCQISSAIRFLKYCIYGEWKFELNRSLKVFF